MSTSVFSKPTVHPVAALFPLLSDEELDDLAADIKANGQIHPIILDKDNILIDGQNRLEACRRAGIAPRFGQLSNGIDPVAFILSNNIRRRHLTKGQQAMTLAMAGGSSRTTSTRAIAEQTGMSHSRVVKASVVLKHLPDLASEVLTGATSLDEAYEKARAFKEAMVLDDQKMSLLRKEAPDLAELIAEERLNLAEAYATFENRKRDAQEKEKSQRETICRIAEDTYRTIIAWSVEDFCKDVVERLGDKEFRENFIKRMRLDPTEIPNIEKGAIALTAIINLL